MATCFPLLEEDGPLTLSLFLFQPFFSPSRSLFLSLALALNICLVVCFSCAVQVCFSLFLFLLSFYLSICLSVYLSVRLFVFVCPFLPLSLSLIYTGVNFSPIDNGLSLSLSRSRPAPRWHPSTASQPPAPAVPRRALAVRCRTLPCRGYPWLPPSHPSPSPRLAKENYLGCHGGGPGWHLPPSTASCPSPPRPPTAPTPTTPTPHRPRLNTTKPIWLMARSLGDAT